MIYRQIVSGVNAGIRPEQSACKPLEIKFVGIYVKRWEGQEFYKCRCPENTRAWFPPGLYTSAARFLSSCARGDLN